MAFKISSLIFLVVTVVGEIHHPSFYQDSSTYVIPEDYIIDTVDGFNAIFQKQNLPVIYNSPSLVRSQGSSGNYLIPIADSSYSISSSNSALGHVVSSAPSWTHDHVPLTYSSSSHLELIPNLVQVRGEANHATGLIRQGETPFGYVAPVAKINVPPGYKIH